MDNSDAYSRNKSQKEMKERPILMSTEMVKAILAGRKTQTRRILNPQPNELVGEGIDDWEIGGVLECSDEFEIRRSNYEWIADIKNRYGHEGDILWVRESFFDCSKFKDAPLFSGEPTFLFWYKADESFIGDHRWKPSIHMPKEAARIWLQLEAIRIEPLQDISEEDAIAEGVGSGFQMNAGWPDYEHIKNGICELTQDSARMSYATLWDSINNPQNKSLGLNPDLAHTCWDYNPWVWAITFKVLSTTGRPSSLQESEVAHG